MDDEDACEPRAGAADASWLHSAGPAIPAAVPAAASDERRRLRGARTAHELRCARGRASGGASTGGAVTSGLLVSVGLAMSVPHVLGGDEGERHELGRFPAARARPLAVSADQVGTDSSWAAASTREAFGASATSEMSARCAKARASCQRTRAAAVDSQ